MTVQTNLVFKLAAATAETLAAIGAIDRAVLDFEREAEHRFLLNDRMAYLYYRDDQVVGYGYMGKGTGPIALLHASDYPAVLAHAENDAVERGDQEFGVHVPLINRDAVNYLLARQCRLDGFTVLFMSDEPFGKFENYIICSPDYLI